MKKNIKILFTCTGRRVSLLKLFREACLQSGLDCTIIGTDTNDNSAALQCCDHKHIVPPVDSPQYSQQIIDIVKEHHVDILIPTVDLDLMFLAENRDLLKEMGCTVLISTPQVVSICQDKRKTHNFLTDNGFLTPEIMNVDQAIKSPIFDFPYFLKPWDGSASRGNVIVKNAEELIFYSTRVENCLVQEFIEGVEHTVDVLVDFDGQVRCAVPRERIEIRDGEVRKARTVKNDDIIQKSKKLVEVLGAGPGVITIQCFLTPQNDVQFIEINPRFGGGIPLSIQAGANFPYWIIQLWLGNKPQIALNNWKDNLYMLRYDEAVWCQR